MRIKLTILAIISLSVFRAYAQYDFRKGYIVTDKSDTIQGYLDYANPSKNARTCFFKRDLEGVLEQYEPKDIQGYRFAGSKSYVSRDVPVTDTTRLFFVEYLVDGVVDLYYLKEFDDDQFFMEKNGKLYRLSNEKVTRIINDTQYVSDSKAYVGMLLFLMQDAEPLKGKIEGTEFNLKSLIEITKDYHHQVCDSVQCIDYYKKEKKVKDTKWRVRLGLSIGYNHSMVSVNSKLVGGSFGLGNDVFLNEYVINESNASFESAAQSFVPAIFLNIRRNHRTSFQLEAKYQKSNHQSITLEEVKLPVLFNYEFLYYKNPRPYFSVGIVNDFTLRTKVRGLYFNYEKLTRYGTGSGYFEDSEYSYTTFQENVNERALDRSHFSFGFCLGLGVRYDLGENSSLKIEVRGETAPVTKYRYSLNNAPFVATDITNSNVCLSVNYIF